MSPSEDLPALLGGRPVRPQGPPGWPVPDEAVREALEAAYQDGSWGRYQGGKVERVEQRLRQTFAVPFALTCGSGTYAVELALRALRVGPGDEVILAAYDYPGNFLAVHAVGARPVLAEVAADTWALSPENLEPAFRPQTRAMIVSHLHGGLAAMPELLDLAGRRGVPVIEDAAQAPGARVKGRLAGTWGDVGILSFGGSKLLTAGRGGALLTARADVHQRARLALVRGNHLCPLSELQAAVLLPQLDALPARNARRLEAVESLRWQLADLPGLRLLPVRAGDEPAYYKVGLQWSEESGLARGLLTAALRAEGIAVDEGFRALHVGRAPTRFQAAGPLAEAERAGRACMVLHHPVLLGSEADLAEVGRAFHKVHACRALLKAASASSTLTSREGLETRSEGE